MSNFTSTTLGNLVNVFNPLVSTKGADVGYQINGTDISNIFEPSATAGSDGGADQTSYTTGFQHNKKDLRMYFQYLGYTSGGGGVGGGGGPANPGGGGGGSGGGNQA
jgi:hypothetical protein